LRGQDVERCALGSFLRRALVLVTGGETLSSIARVLITKLKDLTCRAKAYILGFTEGRYFNTNAE
jgi:hypothetical protein